MIIHWISEFCLVTAAIGCLYLFAATVLTMHFTRERTRLEARPAPVSILKPLHGEAPRMFECLASFCSQRYQAPVQIVFGIEEGDDRAAAVVARLRAAFPDKAIDLKVHRRADGGNRKVSNLMHMAALARHGIVVLADSDIEVAPDYLDRVLGELQRPGTGAVTCLYHGVADAGLWARLSALAINAQFLPNVVVGVSCALAQPCFGSTIAFRREMLARIGGLERFAECLADDYAIGEAVRAEGREVVIPQFSLGHICNERTAQGLLSHELRWARTIRSIDPVGYFGSLISHPFPLAILASVTGSHGAVALAVAAIAILCRGALLNCVERRFRLGRQSYWLLPARDLLSFSVFLWGLFGNTVNWNGATYQLMSDGTLVEDRRTPLP